MCLRRAPEKYIAGVKAPAGAALDKAAQTHLDLRNITLGLSFHLQHINTGTLPRASPAHDNHTCRIWSSDETFKSHQLRRKYTDSAPNTGTASTHIPTASQFTSRYHQTTGDWDDICPSTFPPDFMCKCSFRYSSFSCVVCFIYISFSCVVCT
jgi:hypothetical protein